MFSLLRLRQWRFVLLNNIINVIDFPFCLVCVVSYRFLRRNKTKWLLIPTNFTFFPLVLNLMKLTYFPLHFTQIKTLSCWIRNVNIANSLLNTSYLLVVNHTSMFLNGWRYCWLWPGTIVVTVRENKATCWAWFKRVSIDL